MSELEIQSATEPPAPVDPTDPVDRVSLAALVLSVLGVAVIAAPRAIWGLVRGGPAPRR